MKQALKAYGSLQLLPEFRKALKALEQRLAKLEEKISPQDKTPSA
jgi:BMFP domain-containing protein YqiC